MGNNKVQMVRPSWKGACLILKASLSLEPGYPWLFSLVILDPAVKESAGYPDINATIFVPPVPEDSRPEVDLTPSSRLHLDIQLGPPDGIFEGTVVDATTNTPIKTARITMRREDIEHGYYSTGIMGGHFLFALPSAPVEITITAPGYAPWKYKDSKSEVQNLTLSSSERRSLTIELTPIK